MPESKPIFFDQEKRRWRRTRLALEIAGGIFTVVLIVFLLNVVRNPELPELMRPDVHGSLHAIHLKRKLRVKFVRRRKRRMAALGKIPQNYEPLRMAFYVSDDYMSFVSLQEHFHQLDLVVPDALHAVYADGSVQADADEKLTAFVQSLKSKGTDLPVMPMVNNYDGKKGWCPPDFLTMLASASAREKLATQLEQYAAARHEPGIVVDFESLPQPSQQQFESFVHDLSVSLHAKKLKLMVALPAADWSYNYKYIASQADAIILMNYDFRWPTSPPGPIAPQDWYVRNINNMVKIVPPDKLIMGIANYGYDWPNPTKQDPHPVATALSFQQGVVTAVESGADALYDPDTFNLHYSYEDGNGRVHTVWMLDGVTAYNQLRAAERAGVAGTALWRLGMEDPSIWTIWDATHADEATRDKLETVPPGYDLIFEGNGDVLRITGTPQNGSRTLDYDADSDDFDDESYQSYPMSWRIQQIGGGSPRQLALTFDDGPDPTWTPQILDVLDKKGAVGTFFVIGEEANQYDNIVKREYALGDEIGNHTFTHPDFEDITKPDLQIQLNLTEMLIESSLGVKTTLFRPPYGVDVEPESASEIHMLPVPQEMGYLIVGGRVDPHDWGELDGGPPPPTEKIVKRVVDQVEAHDGNIILLHDGGGNRSHTVAALPQIIDQLRSKGYEFVSVSQLLGETRAQVMPPLAHKEWLTVRVDAAIFGVFRWLRRSIAFIFIAGILLASGRALIIGLLALIEKFRPAPEDHPEYKPPVTVLIPAYNEEAVIVDTVSAALASNYPKLEVLVVDDGSKDRTAELVRREFGRDGRVRLLEQENRGKPSALNHGLAEATGEIIVSIDADTIVDPQAIPRLVRHFADPKVGAVAGNVKVMNRNRWITRWQALEYITSQNLEKRAFDLLNCIPVVPGAVGAWRASVLRDHAGFSGETVAEDTDLTLTIRREGWKITYDEDAIGHTEVPETVDGLIRQRFRWTFGTLQAAWKHRDTAGNPRYGTLGWVAIPNIVLFQILLPLISPVIDLLFLLSIALWGLAQLRVTQLPQLWTSADVERSLIFFALFMLIDLFTCVVAFALERHEDWTLLAPLLIQRFYYRQMMYVVLFRAVKEAVRGHAVGWRGVEPHVHQPSAPTPTAPVLKA